MATRINPTLEDKLKTLFYGQPGSTKTRTAATAALDPRLSPVLYLEQGGNPLSMRSYTRWPDIVHMEKLSDYNPIYDWLLNGQKDSSPIVDILKLKPPYKTLVIDSITEVQRYSFRTVIGSSSAKPGDIPASAERQHFNKVLSQMVNFANLFYQLPMHVILTSLESETKNEATGDIFYKPLLWGQSSGEVPGYAYLVARMVHRARIEGKMYRVIGDAIDQVTSSVALFQPAGTYMAKDQYGCMGGFMPDPTIGKMLDLLEEQLRAFQIVETQHKEE